MVGPDGRHAPASESLSGRRYLSNHKHSTQVVRKEGNPQRRKGKPGGGGKFICWGQGRSGPFFGTPVPPKGIS